MNQWTPTSYYRLCRDNGQVLLYVKAVLGLDHAIERARFVMAKHHVARVQIAHQYDTAVLWDSATESHPMPDADPDPTPCTICDDVNLHADSHPRGECPDNTPLPNGIYRHARTGEVVRIRQHPAYADELLISTLTGPRDTYHCLMSLRFWRQSGSTAYQRVAS